MPPRNSLNAEDFLKASPDLLGRLCAGQHAAQAEFLYNRILRGNEPSGDGGWAISGAKVESLKKEANTAFQDLSPLTQKGIIGAIVRCFSPVVTMMAAQQLANIRLSKLLAQVEKSRDQSETLSLIEKAKKEWSEPGRET